MTLAKVCKSIAEKTSPQPRYMWNRLEKVALELNDNSTGKAALWLKKVINPELFPSVDPRKVEADYYTLVCYDCDGIYFCRKYDTLRDAQFEMERQYESLQNKSDDNSEPDGSITENYAWLEAEYNTVSLYALTWEILECETSRFADYVPLQ